MFKGKYTYSEWPDSKYVEVEGCDLSTHMIIRVTNVAEGENLLSQGTYSEELGLVMPPPPSILIHTTPTRIEVTGAQIVPGDLDADPRYNWDMIKELSACLWEAKYLCTEENLTVSQDTVWGPGSGAEKVYQIGDFCVKLVSGSLECVEGSSDLTVGEPRFSLTHSQSVDLGKEEGVRSKKVLHLDCLPPDKKAKSGDSDAVSDTNPYANMQYRSFEEILQDDEYPEGTFEWLQGKNYEIVTPENVVDVCKTMMNHDGVIAFDTETTGLNINFKSVHGDGDQLVGLVFSIEEGQSWYMPLRHNHIRNVCSEEEIPGFMEAYIKPILQTKKIVLFNAAFDGKVVLAYNILLNIHADVQIMYHLTYWHEERGVPNPDNPKMVSESLKALSTHYLQRRPLDLSMFLPDGLRDSKKNWEHANFADLPEESVRLYACADSDNTLALYNLFMKNHAVEQYGAAKTLQIEHAFANCIAYSEFFGTHYNPDSIEPFTKEIEERKSAAQAEMEKIAGKSFNPRSTKQLISVLIDDLGMPVVERTKTGNPSASKTAISKYKEFKTEDGELMYPIIGYLEKYKECATAESSFLKPIEKNSSGDGFFFCSIKALLETGRMATTGPNIQGTPGFVKKYYTSRDGYYTLNFDFSSIEYRLLACLANEPSLVEFFYDPLKDYHRKQASVLFETPYSKVTPKMRKLAKPFNFALPYGKGDMNLGKDLFGTVSDENTEKAAELRRKYFAEQPNVEKFFDNAKAEASANLWVETYFGRRRYFDPIRMGQGDHRKGYATMLRAAGNHKIQGTAADLYKMGIIRLYNQILQRGWFGKMILSAMVHDECNLEVHNSIPPWVAMKVILDTVVVPIKGWCPLYIGAGYGVSWDQAKNQELPVAVQHRIAEFGEEGPPDFEWDGDIQKWVAYTEKMRDEYLAEAVSLYVTEEEHWNDDIDPDILECAYEYWHRNADESVQGTMTPAKALLYCLSVHIPGYDSLDEGKVNEVFHLEAPSEDIGVAEESSEDSEVDYLEILQEIADTQGIEEALRDRDVYLYVQKEDDGMLQVALVVNPTPDVIRYLKNCETQSEDSIIEVLALTQGEQLASMDMSLTLQDTVEFCNHFRGVAARSRS